MARTDYYGIQTPVLQATSQAIRTVNGTVGTIAPEDYPDLISAMHSQSDYDNVMAQLVEETTTPASIASFTDGANNLPCKNIEVNVTAWQEGTGDPAPDNERPIHGFSAVNVIHCGKNIAYLEQGSVQTWNGTLVDSTTRVRTNLVRVIGGQTYVASTNGWSVRNGCRYDKNGNFIAGDFFPNEQGIITIPNGTEFVRFVYSHANTSEECTPSDFWYQLELGSTATAYDAYTGNTYTIQLGDEIFGGKVNFTTGVMTVTHLTYILPTTENFTQWYNRQTVVVRPPNIIQTIQNVLNVYGDVLKATSSPLDDFACWHRYSNVTIIVSDDYTVADYNNNIAGTKIIYPLEEPFTVQLTPQQIKTRLGNNEFFADTGDISMTYRANGALYVAQH